MILKKYWPSLQNCLDCIKSEAENPSDAVFLAVHQKMTFVRTSFATQQTEAKTERQLLNDFLRDDPSGRVIMPILGESGIGKSHLIRWLNVQLRKRDDSQHRHVILIPKSSSLKSVLGRILDGLGGTDYEEIRTKLKSAREKMDDIGARNSVRAALLSAIERKFEAASENKKQSKLSGKKLSEEDKLWCGHGGSNHLRAIFNDPATEVMFFSGTNARPGIISELARHLTEDTKNPENAPRREFEEEDFLIPDKLSEEISQAGAHARSYLTKLNASNDRTRKEVLSLLNKKFINDTIAPLATPADTSLSELFYDVRKLLLSEGRELVLLVEDFAVLAGVQGALLDAMIREGEVRGEAEACMIRTALAVTDGYFEDFDTVKTRAGHGWRIEATTTEAESITVDRISNFVAAYLNAARIGASKLEEHYLASQGKQYQVPNAKELFDGSEEENELLSGFGTSETGLSLFPFNRHALAELANWKLRNSQEVLRFHPRTIIKEIVRPVVEDYKSEFENGEFPPLNFLGYQPRFRPDLTTEVKKIQPNKRIQNQSLYLLRFWGGDPSRVDESKVPLSIYEAFGLPPLHPNAEVIVPEIHASNDTEQEEKRSPLPDKPIRESEPKPIRDLIECLERWREGTSGSALTSGDSTKLRKLIGETVFESINWESLLLQQMKKAECSFAWKNTFIPNAKGNQTTEDEAFVKVVSEEDFKNEAVNLRIFLELRALVRFDHHKNWDYPGGDLDYARLLNFIESRLPMASQWVTKRYQNIQGDIVPSLTQSLLWQSRILNVPSAHRSDDASLISSIFENVVVTQKRDDDWQFFLLECETTRPSLQKLLVNRIAAWQGRTGRTVHAIDAAQLLPFVKQLKKEWEITETFPRITTAVDDEIQNAKEYCNRLTRGGAKLVKDRRKQVLSQSKQVIKELGASFDKNELVKTFEEIIETAQKNGLPGEVTSGQMKKLVEAFRIARSKEVLDQIKVIEENESGGAMLSAIAMLDGQTHKLLVEFADKGARYVKERIGAAQAKIGDWTDEVVKSKTDEVDNLLAELETIATEFSGGKP